MPNQPIFGAKLAAIGEAVDYFVYPSRKIAELDLLQYYPQYAQKCRVIYNGVDGKLFKPVAKSSASAQELLVKYNLQGHKILLFIGRLVAEKAVDQILAALSEVLNAEKSAVLLIVGSSFFGKSKVTNYVKRLRKLAEPLKGAVRFTGFLPNQDLPLFYSLADHLSLTG